MRKIKLNPTSKQKKSLLSHYYGSKYTYNTVINYINNNLEACLDVNDYDMNRIRILNRTVPYNDDKWTKLNDFFTENMFFIPGNMNIYCRDKFVTAYSGSEKKPNPFFTNDNKWVLNTPKVIRQQAVFEAFKNLKSASTNLIQENIPRFYLGYKRRKYKTWTIGIEKQCCLQHKPIDRSGTIKTLIKKLKSKKLSHYKKNRLKNSLNRIKNINGRNDYVLNILSENYRFYGAKEIKNGTFPIKEKTKEKNKIKKIRKEQESKDRKDKLEQELRRLEEIKMMMKEDYIKYKEPKLDTKKFGKKRMGRDKNMIRDDFDPQGDCFIHKDSVGDYYLLMPIQINKERTEPDYTKPVVGIDPGVRTFITTCDIENNYNYVCTNFEEKVERLIRKKKMYEFQSTKYNIDNTRIRYFKKLIRNRKDEIKHKCADFLTKKYNIILLPFFKVKSMVKKNIKLSRRSLRTKDKNEMINQSHYAFKQYLKSKAEERGCTVIDVSEHATTITCSRCFKITRSCTNRIHNCVFCHLSAGRDSNAAKNILVRNSDMIGSSLNG
jgi:transposase